MKPLLLAVATTLVTGLSTAHACPGKETAADASEHDETHADATRCAKKAELVGTACSYSTGMMAQRVHADGDAVRLTAKLEKATGTLPSKVAAPFMANDEYHVIANEVVDGMDASKPLALTGKTLEVDGIKYLLVTEFAPANS